MTHAVWLTASAPALDRIIAQSLLAEPTVSAVVCVYDVREPFALGAMKNVRCVHADFHSARSLRDVLSSQALHDVDSMVHVLRGCDGSNGDVRAQRSHSDVTRELLHLAEQHSPIQRFVLQTFANVYRLDSREPVLIDENHALDLVSVPAAMRACAEADFSVCEKLACSRLQLVVLRCAEVLAAAAPSALRDYLSSRVCLRPLGYDPMLNVLSIADLASAISCATASTAAGIFNIPGADTLPLSELIHATGRIDMALPGSVIGPLYGLRAHLTRGNFNYATDATRFHYGCVLDGSKARRLLGYSPSHPTDFERLFARA